MSDHRPHHPTSDPDGYDRPESTHATRNIPLLAWIVVAILIGWFAVAMLQRGGTHRTPRGGTHPQAAEPQAYVPPAPGGEVNGPQQPASR